MNVGLRIRNNSITPYKLEQLFITMMQWQASPDPSFQLGRGVFRTLATLRPTGDDFNVVLAPGESTQVIQVGAQDLNPSIVKQFLARPSAIFYEPAGLELSNEDEINFDFLTAQTFARTATLNIDYDNGTLERYLVATNVNRDANGELAGITLGTILKEIVGITPADDPGPGVYTTDLVDGVQVLTSIRGVENHREVEKNQIPNDGDPVHGVPRDPMRVWAVYIQETEHADGSSDFEDTIVKHGDVVRLIYTADMDGDGLLAPEEDIYGSSDAMVDTDLDGLTDFQEVKVGWTVSITDIRPGRDPIEYRVYSSPIASDQDGDGLSDLDERGKYCVCDDVCEALDCECDGPFQQKCVTCYDCCNLTEEETCEEAGGGWVEGGTDPRNPDTDDDTLIDSLDPHPLTPAKKLYVDASVTAGGDGTSWNNAYKDLNDALREAVDDTPDDDLDDISQIWIAAGAYYYSATWS